MRCTGLRPGTTVEKSGIEKIFLTCLTIKSFTYELHFLRISFRFDLFVNNRSDGLKVNLGLKILTGNNPGCEEKLIAVSFSLCVMKFAS